VFVTIIEVRLFVYHFTFLEENVWSILSRPAIIRRSLISAEVVKDFVNTRKFREVSTVNAKRHAHHGGGYGSRGKLKRPMLLS